ncbi:hypothetical protein J6590_051375, partial [Homalodisca vitripennis]
LTYNSSKARKDFKRVDERRRDTSSLCGTTGPDNAIWKNDCFLSSVVIDAGVLLGAKNPESSSGIMAASCSSPDLQPLRKELGLRGITLVL